MPLPAYHLAMDGVRVGDFRPSVHGLHFPNTWPPGPTLRLGPLDPRWFGIGDASQGLCGGMCFVVGDLWAAGVLPPADREPPAFDTPRFRRLVHRQVESLDWLRLPASLWLRSVLPDDPRPDGGHADGPPPRSEPDSEITAVRRRLGAPTLGRLTVERDWPAIRARLEAGRLAMLGLVRMRSASLWALVGNHQVVAYGYRLAGRDIRIAVYDPNHADRDDVELVLELARDGGVRCAQTTGEPLRGCVLVRYRPEPPGPWRA